ncbi:ABC transporter ATP-binding protein, partial [Vagococcus fluvialis]
DLLEKKSKEGMTIFLSSHDLHEIQAHCDRAAFIKNGEIIAVEMIDKGKDLEKKVTLTSNEVTIEELAKIGATQVNQKETYFEFIYQQDINPLLTYLSQKKIADVEIKPLDLEDKFLSMYE